MVREAQQFPQRTQHLRDRLSIGTPVSVAAKTMLSPPLSKEGRSLEIHHEKG